VAVSCPLTFTPAPLATHCNTLQHTATSALQDTAVKLERNKDKMYTMRITRKDEKVLRTKQGTYSVVETRKDGVKVCLLCV